MSDDPIAIVGLGGVFPDAPTVDDLWRLVAAGRDASREVPPGRWPVDPTAVLDPTPGRPDRVYSTRGCFVEDFELDTTGLDLDPRFAARCDPSVALAVHAGAQAWRSARMERVDRSRVAVVLGNIVLPTERASALASWILGHPHALDRGHVAPPSGWDRFVAGLPAGVVAAALGLGGEQLCLDAACASSLFAIHHAVTALRSGRADAVLAGGVSRPDCFYTQMGFSQLRALSARGRCAPFDRRGDGLVVGEGAGVVVLKRLADARAHGDRIWAVVRGVGLSNDVAGKLLAPSTDGQLRAMRAAYRQAGWTPAQVQYVECHATGTPVGDAVELESLSRLREGAAPCPIGAVKANVGHLLTAAGAVALIKVLLAMDRGVVPPVANFEIASPKLAVDDAPIRIPTTPETWDAPVRRAAVSGFGFGGTNAHVLLEGEAGLTAAGNRVAVPPGVSAETPVHGPAPPTVVVVGIEAWIGAHRGLDAVTRFWFAPERAAPAAKRRFAGLDAPPVGYCVDEVEIEVGRFRIPPRELQTVLPQQLLVLEVCRAALHDAGLQTLEGERAGCFVGLGLDLGTTDYHLRWCAPPGDADAVGPALDPNRVLGGLGSIAASRVARELGIGGPAYVVATEDTSGLAALQVAAAAIEAGDLDIALVAAVDLRADPRTHFADRAVHDDPRPLAEGAAAVVLRRADATSNAYAKLRGFNAFTTELRADSRTSTVTLDTHRAAPSPDVGAATGLLDVVRACASLRHRLRGPAHVWLRDRADGPRTATVTGRSITGDVRSVELEDAGPPRPLPVAPAEELFIVEADTVAELVTALGRPPGMRQPDAALAVCIVATDLAEARTLATAAADALQRGDDPAKVAVGKVFFAREPLRGDVAFVFPGSGAHTAGMGRALAAAFPDVVLAQDAANTRLASQLRPELAWAAPTAAMDADIRGLILAQVAYGTLASDVLRRFGVEPDAVVGYSLGETAGLFALGVWRDRDTMLQRVESSPLFTEDLAGPCRAAAQAWGTDRAAWATGVVEADAATVDAALKPRAYRLIVNTDHACVIGGDPAAVDATVAALGARFHPLAGISTVHCPVVRPVEAAYRELHRLPTTPTRARVYAGAWGHAYEPDTERCAAAITDQALHGLDFPRLIRTAHDDGVRLFIELGPGSSCTRMIESILADRPSCARALATPAGRPGVLRTLATLLTHRVPVRVDNPPAPAPPAPRGPALRIPVGRPAPAMVSPGPRQAASSPEAAVPTVLDRPACLRFAVGSIAAVLGPRYAEIDRFPTRVRLPDEPLMLVDRILAIDGEPLSMQPGRVVTEHDVTADRWYLDAGRIPTCVAVEAGQADLFLSSYLGIDTQTRGEAVYRLLDATVQFHGPLPGVGDTIHYDIRIERFFRHGDTWMFRFQFDATVAGRLLMTMRDGCAGFFTAQQLRQGRGIVRPRNQPPGHDAPHEPPLVPVSGQALDLDPTQLAALRRGDLATAFGPAFADLPLSAPLTLPDALQLQLVHRVTDLDPSGGAHGRGFVRAEADIHPDAWFLTCHFVDDQVMPGTLMYECCLHCLRILLLRRGCVGEADRVAFEPVPGVRSRLVCRGQVLATTKTVRYEVTIREVGYRDEPYAIADAAMFADGKHIVDIHDMALQLTGATRASLQALWGAGGDALAFTKAQLVAFAEGDPSAAFGEPYQPFDSDRQIARLPAPPLQFIDRVTSVSAPAFGFKPGVEAVAEVDAATFAWTLEANRQPEPAYAVLLEAALQPCGFLAAHVGSALHSDRDLRFRNLGGDATLHRRITPDDRVLRTRARMTDLSHSAGMIIQHFSFELGARGTPIYSGTTYFGFFTADALADQVGLRDVPPYEGAGEGWREGRRGKTFPLPDAAPLPAARFRMVDAIDVLDPEGFVEGSAKVDPGAWFFAAHFVQDPVWPGSLGVEGFLQLLKAFAVDRWDLGATARFATLTPGQRHRWTYRGQITPAAGRVRIQARITAVDDDRLRLVADGLLFVDDRPIYRMHDFGLEVTR